VNHLAGDDAFERAHSPVEEFVERLLELQPRLQRALQVQLPTEIGARLGSVTPHQLEALGRLPRDGTTMREFANAVGISGAAATALANRMIRGGLAERRYDPNDRRTVWLAPTPEALEALEVVHSWRRQSVAKMLERLDAVQVTSFLEVLSTLAHSPHSASADPEAPALP
jgi:DNA-binding MarR family transcriptional regulator